MAEEVQNSRVLCYSVAALGEALGKLECAFSLLYSLDREVEITREVRSVCLSLSDIVSVELRDALIYNDYSKVNGIVEELYDITEKLRRTLSYLLELCIESGNEVFAIVYGILSSAVVDVEFVVDELTR